MHPACALIADSIQLQRTADTVGLATAVSMSQDESVAGYYDTMALASIVMQTHALEYALSSVEVAHYFNVSYDERTDLTEAKLHDVRRRLAVLRTNPLAHTEAGPWG